MSPTAALRPVRGGGFTLLELLVVMLIVGLLAGVAAPLASRWLEAAEQRGWRHDLRALLEQYPVRAFLAGEPLLVDEARLRRDLATWPEAAGIRLSEPLRYAPSGAAGGGEIRLQLHGWRARWRVQPVDGRVEELADAE